MLGHCSRFPPLSVISSLIRRTLEFQHKKDLVGPINHDVVRSPSPKNDLVVGVRFIPPHLLVVLQFFITESCPSFAASRPPLLMSSSLSASSLISSHGKKSSIFVSLHNDSSCLSLSSSPMNSKLRFASPCLVMAQSRYLNHDPNHDPKDSLLSLL